MTTINCLPFFTLTLAAVLTSCEETTPLQATPVTSEPSVPLEYTSRWLKEENYYQQALKLPEGNLDQPDSWSERNISLLREALRVAPRSFANVNLLTLQMSSLPRELNERFTPSEVFEIKQMLVRYLQHLQSVADQPEAPERLAWHALAVSAMTARLWPSDFQKQTFENTVSRLVTTPVWERNNSDDGEEWYGEYRASDTRLLIMDDDSWRLLNFDSMQWEDIALPVSKNGEQSDPFRVGMGSTALATTGAVFDFTAKTWHSLAGMPESEVYFDDPVEAGDEWIAFYKNPPHYNLEKVPDFDRLPKAEQDRLIDSLRDRFYFQGVGVEPRSLATGQYVDEWFVLPSSKLLVSASQGHFPHNCQIKQSLLLTPDAAKRSLEPKLEGYFNGTWSIWRDGGEKAMLEQFADYEGRIPSRAAVLDLQTGRWELLWNAPKPAIPAPPPGVLQPVLDQPARWELPDAISQSAIGTVLNVTPGIAMDRSVYLLSLTRDVLASTFSVDFWIFHPNKRQPQRFHLVLPGYRPCTTWDDDFPLPALKRCKNGFLIADAVCGRFWHLKWPVSDADSAPTKQ